MAYPATLETLPAAHVDNAAEVIRAADINDLARIENSLMRKVGFGFSEPTGVNQVLAGNTGSTSWQTFLPLGANAAAAGQIRLPNDVAVNWRNAANSADLGLKLNASNQLELAADVAILDKNVVLSATTGTRLGTATTQKLGLWNAIPVAQHSSTGESAGFTAGGGTTATHLSTFTGNVGTKAYTVSDIVKALKNCGIMAAT